MKLLLSVIVLGLFVTAFAPQAEARICADGAHRPRCSVHKRVAHKHHYRHIRRYSENGFIVAVPSYVYYYPPMPATIFDLPPERGFPDQLQ